MVVISLVLDAIQSCSPKAFHVNSKYLIPKEIVSVTKVAFYFKQRPQTKRCFMVPGFMVPIWQRLLAGTIWLRFEILLLRLLRWSWRFLFRAIWRRSRFPVRERTIYNYYLYRNYYKSYYSNTKHSNNNSNNNRTKNNTVPVLFLAFSSEFGLTANHVLLYSPECVYKS